MTLTEGFVEENLDMYAFCRESNDTSVHLLNALYMRDIDLVVYVQFFNFQNEPFIKLHFTCFSTI